MGNNYLLIVEGKKDEKTIFSNVLVRYGYSPIVYLKTLNIEDVGQFKISDLAKDNNNVFIIQGPKNRIHDFLLLYNKNQDSIERLFRYEYGFFQGIFLVYDVDHNDCDDIRLMFDKFNDESSGMLLLSSPSIEVLGDYNHDRKDTKYRKIKEYKKDLNTYYSKDGSNVIEYITKNFEKCALYFLEKNVNDFNEHNVMEHPKMVVEWINKHNTRVNCENKDDSYVIYRYYTTVVYVFIAFIKGLTKEIDNSELVKKFLLKEIKKETTD